MTMSMRERILAVYRGQTPDVVPYMLDLSHWFYHKNRMPWDLSVAFEKPEYELIDYHHKAGAGFYVPNLGTFYRVQYSPDVQSEVWKEWHGRRSPSARPPGPSGGAGAGGHVPYRGSTSGPAGEDVPEIVWRLTTPLGSIERRRIWEETSYSWAISRWGIQTEQDLRVLGYALASRTYTPVWEQYHAWDAAVGDIGVVYLLPGYSAMGHLLHYWFGVAGTIYAAADWPNTLRQVVDEINDNNLKLIDLLAASPADVICMGDNFSSNIQSPRFFRQWSRAYYVEAIRRLHAAGKYVAVHIDGKLRGAIGMIRDAGADCGDAITPAPMGDLTPLECRQEAGPDFILSGGVPPNLWLPQVDVEVFKKAVLDWLELKKHGPRFIANAGDQVPPGADEDRIEIMRELVEKYGRY